MTRNNLLFASCFLLSTTVSGFTSVVPNRSGSSISRTTDSDTRLAEVISPFGADDSGDTTTKEKPPLEGPLELTWENVDAVLDEMRHFLIQDGGNVAIQEIDGPVVRLELQGACGTCPSSTQTMKMGLERGLKEKIPEIQEVIQAMPEGPPLDDEQVDVVLAGVRPFLTVAGGSIEIDRIEGEGGLQPTIWLDMQGSSASLNSVKLEIAQRLQRHFMMSGLRVEWV
mmetsp:Transcript_472/g.1056  ORF Transcript_472/g.1056 Transcript_472/m.1056 type:complete len:226 (+) Transcript_472:181-858(+)|eukprot:CAMPEP_0197186944 /NCGR_PEP_ID=MMETSP1423-20130617/14909_1 /TAXON_ID=476441 /ORGANISM="Pseudo-nitzschia heimii, Strain UNC1101" /LENGTH=225 /DNA_ID=CAMNT_0042638391 /DNA_START=149 /DNA_END=826 /DNA_ORIENTATION=+